MQTGCGVVFVSNGGNEEYHWLCDSSGPITFYPDDSGIYKFTVLTGFPSDPDPSEALPTKANSYEFSEETGSKLGYSVLIRSNDCVYFPEPIVNLFQFELGDCPPKQYQGESVINPYRERKQYDDSRVTLPTELRPSQPTPDLNSAEIEPNSIADAGPFWDSTEITFPSADPGSWS